jgi:anti-sigma regulatory factor (Ser/Thr protein kinase)
VRAFVQGVAIDGAGLDAMVLCVSEAVTNAVLHAYPEGTSGDVEVEAGLFGDHVDLIVRDRGKGLAPRADSPGFGIGLPLISQMASSAEVQTRASGGTEITMRFELR